MPKVSRRSCPVGFTVTNVSTTGTLTANGAYDGSGDINLLDGSDSLAIGANETITVTVDVTPGANLGPYNNTAVGSGDSPSGTTVTDDSTDGTEPDPEDDGPVITIRRPPSLSPKIRPLHQSQ